MKTIWVDGGCSGNGTPNARMYGSYLYESVTRLNTLSHYHPSNNVAEYLSLIEALKFCDTMHIRGVTFKMDSALVVNQVNKNWKVEQKHLQSLRDQAIILLNAVNGILVQVPREEIFSKLGH